MTNKIHPSWLSDAAEHYPFKIYTGSYPAFNEDVLNSVKMIVPLTLGKIKLTINQRNILGHAVSIIEQYTT